jgi:hypothetical protein
MPTCKVTLKSTQPVDLGDLNAEGFENLLAAVGIAQPFTWQQDAEGDITVTFWHQATDTERAIGASERAANELGIGTWSVSVEEAEEQPATQPPLDQPHPV